MQPVDLPSYKRISGTAAGTTDVMVREGNFHRVIVPISKEGTATFYDQNAGTSAATLLGEVSNAVAGSVNVTREFNFKVKNGLRVVVGGTTDCLVVFS